MRVAHIDLNPTSQGPSIDVSVAYANVDTLLSDEIDKIGIALTNAAAIFHGLANAKRSNEPPRPSP